MEKAMKVTAAEVAKMLKKPAGRIRNVAPAIHRQYAGRTYHSKAEALRAFELDCAKAAGHILGWEPQVALPIRLNGVHICNVVVDFCITELDNSKTYEEIKGFETEVYKLKRKLLLAMYGREFKYNVIKV